MSQFSIGDPVRLTVNISAELKRGTRGSVRGYHKKNPAYVAVEFEKDFTGGSTCDGMVVGSTRGLYVREEQIEYAPTEDAKKTVTPRVGDLVEILGTDGATAMTKGWMGVVRHVPSSADARVGVEFDEDDHPEYLGVGHTLNGKIKKKMGQYYYLKDVRVVERADGSDPEAMAGELEIGDRVVLARPFGKAESIGLVAGKSQGLIVDFDDEYPCVQWDGLEKGHNGTTEKAQAAAGVLREKSIYNVPTSHLKRLDPTTTSPDGDPDPATIEETAPMQSRTKTAVKDLTVVREGTQIILPVGMSFDQGIEWLKRKKAEDEREVRVIQEFTCYPLDGAQAFHKAMADIYGWVDLVPTPGFFGPTPPAMIGVRVGVDSRGFDVIRQIPWGRIQIPGVEGYLETNLQTSPVPKFIISGVTRQRYMHHVEKIVERTKHFLATSSIYKGQAIKISWQWERDEVPFNIQEHCPKFIDLAQVREGDLVFDDKTERVIQHGLFTPIEHCEECRLEKIPLRRGVLLEGPYGTGKTLTALVTALKAVRHGWTFVYLDSVKDFKQGIQFCQTYAPAVMFAEDIDRVVTGERTAEIDEILNILDGLDSKKHEIICVLTTNHLRDINPALQRPGRMDSLVSVRPPGAKAAARLVLQYGRGLLDPACNVEVVGEKLAGKTASLIREVVERSKIAAVHRLTMDGRYQTGVGIKGHVREADLIEAAEALEMHSALLAPKMVTALEVPPEAMPFAKRALERVGIMPNSTIEVIADRVVEKLRDE